MTQVSQGALLMSVSALAVAALLFSTTSAHAQTSAGASQQAPVDTSVSEVVVTAQKRSENINRVGMSITAATAETLNKLGVMDARDLSKVVPGFTFTESSLNTPVYTIRGVGYYETSLAATPAVTVYVDQIPLTYPQMTRNAAFDLERVEVLKGPQGTLFGQNSTGGAVNYIAAKPTDTPHAGVTLTGGRFAEFDASGYASGPIAPNLTGRIAVSHEQRDDWQYSYTRPGDTRGQEDITQGRILLDWKPVERLSFELNVNGWVDRSDSQAAQLVAHTPNFFPEPAFAAYPLAPANARAADWTPSLSKQRHDQFYQGSLRTDYSLTDRIKLTSLTSYSDLREDAPTDGDGTSLSLDDAVIVGRIKSFNQELRVQGDMGHTRWVVGADYSHDTIDERQDYDFRTVRRRSTRSPRNRIGSPSFPTSGRQRSPGSPISNRI